MSRLPTVGGDQNAWGTVLNETLNRVVVFDGSANCLLVNNPYRARATISFSLNVANNTWTTIRFNTLSWDPSGGFDANSGTYTIPVSGCYGIQASVGYVAASGGIRVAAIFVNSVETSRGNEAFVPWNSNDLDVVTMQDQLFLNRNDIVTIKASQTAGSSLTVAPHGPSTHVSIQFMYQ